MASRLRCTMRRTSSPRPRPMRRLLTPARRRRIRWRCGTGTCCRPTGGPGSVRSEAASVEHGQAILLLVEVGVIAGVQLVAFILGRWHGHEITHGQSPSLRAGGDFMTTPTNSLGALRELGLSRRAQVHADYFAAAAATPEIP